MGKTVGRGRRWIRRSQFVCWGFGGGEVLDSCVLRPFLGDGILGLIDCVGWDGVGRYHFALFWRFWRGLEKEEREMCSFTKV